MNRRNYIKNPNKLCFICGKVTLPNTNSNIRPFEGTFIVNINRLKNNKLKCLAYK